MLKNLLRFFGVADRADYHKVLLQRLACRFQQESAHSKTSLIFNSRSSIHSSP